jgi:hypothetical protein
MAGWERYGQQHFAEMKNWRLVNSLPFVFLQLVAGRVGRLGRVMELNIAVLGVMKEKRRFLQLVARRVGRLGRVMELNIAVLGVMKEKRRL